MNFSLFYMVAPGVDERCDMELDETDPTVWLKLEAAVDDYIQNNSDSLKNACERLLLPFIHDEKWADSLKSPHFMKAKATNSVLGESSPSLGWRRNILLVEALNSPDSGRIVHHARALESFCSRNGIRLSLLHDISGISKAVLEKRFPTSFTSHLITESYPSSPLVFSPDVGSQRLGRIDMVPPLSLDGSGKTVTSPPELSPEPRQLSLPLQSLHEKLQNLPQVGIIHMALQNDSIGSILSWQKDVFVVAEPGELADKFLQSVKDTMSSVMQNQNRKDALPFANIADLVHCRPYFQVGNIVHRYVGHQTRVMENDKEIKAYMFCRNIPSLHIIPEDVRSTVGAWRDRIIIFTGTHGPTANLIEAFLDSGAKAVICPIAEPQDVSVTTVTGSGKYNTPENGGFKIGAEDIEGEEAERISPASDREDNDSEKNGNHQTSGFRDEEEEELSEFVCQFYDLVLREGASVDAALKNALASHRKLRYSCHLPRENELVK